MSLIIVFQKKDTHHKIYTKMIKYKEIMYKKYVKNILFRKMNSNQ